MTIRAKEKEKMEASAFCVPSVRFLNVSEALSDLVVGKKGKGKDDKGKGKGKKGVSLLSSEWWLQIC